MKVTAPKLKQIATHLSRGDAPDYVEASEIQVLNQACVHQSGIDLLKVKYQNPDNIDKITSWIHQGDILVNSTGTGTLGRVALVREEPEKPTFADGHVTILRDYFQRFNPKFLFHHLSINQSYLTEICSVGSTNQIELSRAKFGDLELKLPPLAEQCKIADYLDRTTQSIDALITAKKRLLELLAEKRRSMITQAVTRGLTADVPMKDSAIEYLGGVPKHWNIRPLKYLSSFISGATPDKGNKKYWDGTVPWISPKDMKKEYLSTSSELITHLALEETGIKLIEPPAILVVVRGMILLHSFPVAISTSSTTINQDMKALRCRDDILPDFLARQLTARRDEILTMTRESGHGTKAMETTLLENLNILVPPLEEQKTITQYIDKKSIQIDLLVDSAKEIIALLQERRTSLISAAVTGQLQIPD